MLGRTLIIFLTLNIAGCATSSPSITGALDKWNCVVMLGVKNCSNSTSSSVPQAAPDVEVRPTLLEPQVQSPGVPLGPGWYADTITGSASMQFVFNCPFVNSREPRLTLPDLIALHRLNRPDLMAVLDGSRMPDPHDVALMARLAMFPVAKDQGAVAALRALEASGHALSNAWRKYRAEAEALDDRIRSCEKRDLMNIRAAKAIHGDQQALQELSELASLERGPGGPEFVAATRALVAAQHYLRLRQASLNGASTAFWILRSRNFQGGLERIASETAFSRDSTAVACALLGFDCPKGGTSASSWVAGCFPIESGDPWTEEERRLHSSACSPQTRVGFCNSPTTATVMNRLLSAGLRDPELAQFFLAQKSVGLRPVIGAIVTGSTELGDTALGKPFTCTMSMDLTFSPADQSRRDATSERLQDAAKLATPFSLFRAEPSGGQWRIRLTHMFSVELSRRYEELVKLN